MTAPAKRRLYGEDDAGAQPTAAMHPAIFWSFLGCRPEFAEAWRAWPDRTDLQKRELQKVLETNGTIVGVAINHVIEVEGPNARRSSASSATRPSLSRRIPREQTIRIYDTNGESDVVMGELQETMERLTGEPIFRKPM